MTTNQLARLRSVTEGTVQGSTLDPAWRKLQANGYVRALGRGAVPYTALYEITADGRAVIEAHAAAEAAA